MERLKLEALASEQARAQRELEIITNSSSNRAANSRSA